MKKNTFLLPLILAFTLSACSSKDDTNSTKKAVEPAIATAKEDQTPLIQQRAVARWNSLIAKDWKAAYAFESPNYRSTYSLEDFQKSFGNAVTWKSITPISTTLVSSGIADVKLTLSSKFVGDGFDTLIPTSLKERWTYSDKQWWHIKK